MPSAREHVESVCRQMRQRQEQQAEAAALWRRALPRCEQLARQVLEPLQAQGLKVGVGVHGGQLGLAFADLETAMGVRRGARCLFRFNPITRCVDGMRRPWHDEEDGESGPEPEHFYSLTVRLPQAARPSNEFGPSGAIEPVGMDTQESFERAVAQWVEWALVKEGCGGEPIRLP